MRFDQAQNHFDLLGLPVNFRLDTSALAERYRELQKMMHPDQHANASEQEKRLALQQAMLINEAYEKLRNPLTRAIYLLELHGIEVNQSTATTQDSEFLMQQMVLRERLADIKQQADPPATLDALMVEIDQMMQSQIVQLAIQFESGAPEQLVAAQESINKMQFLQKLRHAAEAAEVELEEMI